MKRRRFLSADEQRLWREIARSATPLKGKALPADEPDWATLPVSPVSPAPQAPLVSGAILAAVPAVPASRHPAPPPLHPIERPVRRKIGRGRIALNDRIDLHGMRQDAAHDALLGFLRYAQGSGFRHVLVITGRGASLGSEGVLKRALPHWLATVPFRALVAGFEPAERAHGGSGAFYLRVRRR